MPNLSKRCISVILCCSLGLIACSTPAPERRPPAKDRSYTVYGKRYHPLTTADGYEEKGVASWYGNDFHGKLTSNGEVYDMYSMTAAHKTLPFDTVVRVTNLENGRQALVRINDRGPFVKDRIIDLSLKGAQELGIENKGTTFVSLEALGKERKTYENGVAKVWYENPATYDVGDFTVQVGSFLSRLNAERLRDSLAREFENAHIVNYETRDNIFYRVRVTHASKLEMADDNKRLLESKGYKDAFVVAD